MSQPITEAPARILVVDDEPRNLELMEAILADAGYEVALAADGEAGLARAHEQRPDLIILDLMMPGISGFEVCARIKMDSQLGGVPVLFVTALSQISDKERALAAGGDDFLTKPVQRTELLTRVEALLKVRRLNRDLERALAYLHEQTLTRQPQQPTRPSPTLRPQSDAGVVLVVDDDPVVRQLFSDVLQAKGHITHEAASGPQAVEIARREPIDVVLLDIMMPMMSGLEVLAKLGEITPSSPVIIVTASPTSDNVIAALRLGAFDFIVKGFTTEVMCATVARALERRRLVMRDRALIRQLESKIRDLLALLSEHAEESEHLYALRPRA
jgi:two-component system, OmpR family, alkaline phosphatase synthesis response regulator PhoP